MYTLWWCGPNFSFAPKCPLHSCSLVLYQSFKIRLSNCLPLSSPQAELFHLNTYDYFYFCLPFVVVVHFLNCVQLFVIPWTAACQFSLSFTISQSCSNSCPLSWWYHQTISSSVTPFSSWLQSFPESGSFPISWLFDSGSQSVLEPQLQHQSFQWIFRVDFL